MFDSHQGDQLEGGKDGENNNDHTHHNRHNRHIQVESGAEAVQEEGDDDVVESVLAGDGEGDFGFDVFYFELDFCEHNELPKALSDSVTSIH